MTIYGAIAMERKAATVSNAAHAANAAVVERVLDAERDVEAQVQARSTRPTASPAPPAPGRTRFAGAPTTASPGCMWRWKSRLEREIARMRREFLEAEDSPDNDPQLGLKRDVLQRAVRRLAARMTGEID